MPLYVWSQLMHEFIFVIIVWLCLQSPSPYLGFEIAINFSILEVDKRVIAMSSSMYGVDSNCSYNQFNWV